ncbi:MAG: hypothetical protein IJM03_07725 [Treponema sp.]|nr:hypothetical protein [Treponema sp.]MBR0125220.1 hypothetical protein [Treponema sp.]
MVKKILIGTGIGLLAAVVYSTISKIKEENEELKEYSTDLLQKNLELSEIINRYNLDEVEPRGFTVFSGTKA